MSARRSSAFAGSAEAASSRAAAASAASAPPSRLRGGPGGSTHSSGAAASASGKEHARTAQQVTAASASSSLSGRKRSAAAESVGPSAAAAAAASAAPSSEQSTDSASNAAKSKKQRREASPKERNGPSAAAAAASSVGLDPLPAPSRRPAASSAAAASSASNQLLSRSDQNGDDERSGGFDSNLDGQQEWEPAAPAASVASAAGSMPAASSVTVDVESVASQPHASSSQSTGHSAVSGSFRSFRPEEPADERRFMDWKQQQQLFADAQRLIRGVLPFAEAEVTRLNPGLAAQVRGRMQELTAAKAELLLIDELPLADQANQRAVKRAQIEELTEWIKSHGGTCAFLRTIDTARAVTERQPADIHSMESLGNLCFYLLQFGRFCPPLPPDQQEVFSSWLRRVDALFTRLCAAVPHMALSRRSSHALVGVALMTGALQLIPVLMRGQTERNLTSWTISNDPFLTCFCHDLQSHVVSLQPYLRLFEFGLDPTRIKKCGNPLSALQLARNFVRDHPPAPQAFDPMAAMMAAVAEDIAVDASDPDNWSVLAAHAAHHRGPLGSAETQRREALLARFMHALIPAWLAHSTKVRSLLLDAAPGRLIPPLVDIVSRYLDLQGVPPERSAPVDDAAEMD